MRAQACLPVIVVPCAIWCPGAGFGGFSDILLFCLLAFFLQCVCARDESLAYRALSRTREESCAASPQVQLFVASALTKLT